MPPLPTNSSGRRDVSPGQTFSIVFAVIAVLVVLGCLVLVFLLPKCRKKPRAFPGSRYPVTPNYPHPFAPPPRFPSHPALLRGFRKKSPITVEQYDPRIESPFPHSSAQLNSSDRWGYAVIRSNALFTPPPCCFAVSSRRSDTNNASYILRTAGQPGPDPRKFTTFSAKHENILDVPEPLILKPRSAGRPPPLTRQLERFPMPLLLDSARNKGLIHPVKLFKELEHQHSDTTSESFGTPCPVPQGSQHLAPLEMSVKDSKVCSNAPAPNVGHKSSKGEDQKDIIRTSAAPQQPQLHPKDSHPVECWTSSQKPARLRRMGTLTRPKTPVAEICSRFDQATRDVNNEQSSSSKQPYTPASNPFTTPGLSSTPPTSPELTAKKTPVPSTPPKPHGAPFGMSAPSHAHRRTPSSVMLPSAEKLTALPIATPSKRAHRAARGSLEEKGFKKRSNSGRLKLVSWSKLRPNARVCRHYSSSSLSTIFKPILGPRSQHSHGNSSVYSRDAGSLSFLEAMALPMKGTASPRFEASQIRGPPPLCGGGFTHKQSASTDYLKSKIDNWNLHIGNFESYLPLSSAVKRSVSDIGPRREKAPASTTPREDNSSQARCIPLIQIARSSDDVFGIEAKGFRSDHASTTEKRMGLVAGIPSIMFENSGRGTAPGGAEWI